jgi:hypothetical protein
MHMHDFLCSIEGHPSTNYHGIATSLVVVEDIASIVLLGDRSHL